MAQMGRPRTFDRDAAVVQAMHLFWEHGYESTSLSQLKAGIGGGISAPSFYAAFGSKEALFKEALQHYLNTYGRVTESLFDTALPPRDAIELALRRSARMQCEAGHPRGCMVALGVIGVCSPERAQGPTPLSEVRSRTRAAIQACIERGLAAGELAGTTDVRALTSVFDSFLLGLSTLARDGVEHAALDAAVGQVMGVWDSCRQ
ncbi:TetR/AcrR family transcriptional regulator [Phytopseudomonas dryadis]|uniref:TetR family transcriptional regulator n=1 Tax=Phytopseudomonas dryadis TaxID=2487520 RepID=A0A4Q9R037_9GAMM|nr:MULTISPECIES: TetR/AcrR family transcriptional regulator [Pseudomonas]TBU90581.1 TetR family transcriptional regulator [Pseudomonas dryadis]TBV03756.1 TetR family transcriptional regulator [Pseudomonas dryadis]TBV15973.1 TetR family transcriptional regulator [Pseudomonas sp. FRB 230]